MKNIFESHLYQFISFTFNTYIYIFISFTFSLIKIGVIERPRKVLFRNGMVFPLRWHLDYERTKSLFCPYMGIYGSEKCHILRSGDRAPYYLLQILAGKSIWNVSYLYHKNFQKNKCICLLEKVRRSTGILLCKYFQYHCQSFLDLFDNFLSPRMSTILSFTALCISIEIHVTWINSDLAAMIFFCFYDHIALKFDYQMCCR